MNLSTVFNIEGAELGLDPNVTHQGLIHSASYQHARDAKEASEKLIADEVKVQGTIKDDGGGMVMGAFEDNDGNTFGMIND